MTKTDREEVRQMLHDILSGPQARNESANIVTNIALKEISEHLGKINGKIMEHEIIIVKNLPHALVNCAQSETIREIRENLIGAKAVKKAIYKGVTLTGTIMAILFAIYEILTK